MIDDIRSFYESNFNVYIDPALQRYSTILSLYRLTQELFIDYEFFIIGDIAIICPSGFFTLNEVIKGIAASYLYGQQEDAKEILFFEEQRIENLSDANNAILDSMYTKFRSPYYLFWKAISLKGAGFRHKALKLFMEWQQQNFKHVLLDWYIKSCRRSSLRIYSQAKSV